MLWARIQDAREIWDGSRGEYPQSGPIDGWLGFLLRIKCSICIVMDWKKQNDFDHVPVWVGGAFVNYADPSMSWSEVAVGYGWGNWTYSRYRNGI